MAACDSDVIRSTDGVWAAHVKNYEGVIALLRTKAAEITDRNAQLDARQAVLAEKHGGSAAKGTDKLKLNVGGTRVAVRRETLTLFPDTRLAALFSGRWENRLLRDKKNRIFLDLNPKCFKKIVDFHNLLKIADPDDPPEMPEVLAEDQETFRRLCDFFGLTEVLSPPRPVSSRAAESSHEQRTPKKPKSDAGWETVSLDGFIPEVAEALTVERESVTKSEAQLEKREQSFAEEEAFIDFFASGETKDIVELDVSGEKMAVKRSTLMLCQESALARQFDDAVWTAQQEEEGDCSDSEDEGVMIEHSAYCFAKIVDQLRLRAISKPNEPLPPPPVIVEHERKNFARVVTFYFPGVEEFIITIPPSLILSAEQFFQVGAWLLQGCVISPELLLYRASRDGWAGRNFHSKCDAKGATVTVVKSSGGYIFGGYADQPWSSLGSWTGSQQAFFFALHCHAGLGPTKMPLIGNKNQNAIYCKSNYGPTFGGGHDLHVANDANTNQTSYTNVGHTYQCPPGKAGNAFLTGSQKFQAAEVEVYRLQGP